MLSIIVPFLNGENWLPYFLDYHLSILSSKDQIVLVEGATSFHSPAEHKNGLSVDNSREIISKYGVKYYPKGRVHNLTELISIGYDASRSQEYIAILSVSDFITRPLYDELLGNDYFAFKRLELIGDFSHAKKENGYGCFFRNIEGVRFYDGINSPLLGGEKLSKHTGIKFLTHPVISVENIETKNQQIQRLMAKYKYQKWYYHNISQDVPRINDALNASITEMKHLQLMDRIEVNGEVKDFVAKTFPAHPWYSLPESEIYNLPHVFSISKPSYKRRNKNLLEIGCGMGNLLKTLQDEGWNTYGIENSKREYRYAKYIERLDVFNGEIEEYTPDITFDAVIIWDTVGQFMDPVQSLRKVRSLMDRDAILIVYVSNSSQGYFIYNEKSLRLLLERCGFKVVFKDSDELILGVCKHEVKSLSKPSEIALMRLDGLGGTITLSDQAKKIHDRTGKKVKLVTRGYEVLFENNPHIEEVISVGMRDWRECSIVMRNQFELAEIRFGIGRWYNSKRKNLQEFSQIFEQFPKDYNLLNKYGLHHIQLTDKILGLPYDRIESKIYVDEVFPISGDFILVNNGVDVIHGKMRQTKCWNGWDTIVKQLNCPVVQVGTLNDPLIDGVQDLRGKTNLKQVIYLLKKAKVIVVTEGGLMHLAFAASAPNVIVLGGPTQGPLFEYPGHHWLTSYVCGNCWGSKENWYECCPKDVDAICMQTLSPAHVQEKVEELLQI